jgi:hypothetical protein
MKSRLMGEEEGDTKTKLEKRRGGKKYRPDV